MKFDPDPEAVARMRHRCDGCEFRVVRAYVEEPSSGISQVLFVNHKYPFAEVAAYLEDLDESKSQRAFEGLLVEGVVKVGAQDVRQVRGVWRDRVILLDAVPDHRACQVILIPPLYLVQMAHDYLCEYHNYDRDLTGQKLEHPEINCRACRATGVFAPQEVQKYEAEDDGW